MASPRDTNGVVIEISEDKISVTITRVLGVTVSGQIDKVNVQNYYFRLKVFLTYRGLEIIKLVFLIS